MSTFRNFLIDAARGDGACFGKLTGSYYARWAAIIFALLIAEIAGLVARI